MSTERQERIRAARLRQPPEELARKAAKSATRSHQRTQEEIDEADAEADALLDYFQSRRDAY